LLFKYDDVLISCTGYGPRVQVTVHAVAPSLTMLLINYIVIIYDVIYVMPCHVMLCHDS